MTAASPIWWGTIGEIPADATPTGDEIAVQYAAQAMAYLQPWERALAGFTANQDDPGRRAALSAAHDRYFTTACTAFAAAAMAKGWTPADARDALEMGHGWEHLHGWLWDAMGFEENDQMDDFLARLVTERPEP